jgi:hypothetical protein
MKKIFLLISLVTLSCLALSPATQAITISPVILEDVDAAPGDIVTRQFTVLNETESEQTYYFLARNFTTQGEEGQVVISEENFGLATWIQFPATSVTIPAGQSQDIEFSILIPPNADPGGHSAAVFASTNPPDVSQGLGLSGNVGALLFVRVAGDITEDARLLGFHTKGDAKFYTRLPVDFEYRIENRGTVHIVPQGDVVMSGWFGKTNVNANPLNNHILPSSIRRLETTWVNKTPVAGGFFTEVKNEWNNFALGKYKATLDIGYGKGGGKITGQTDFWVFPWHVLLVALLILIAVIVFIILYNKMVIATAKKTGKL